MRGTRTASGWLRTAAGVVIVVVLLFPLYWMINASLQPGGALLRPNPDWLPVDGTFDGYRKALSTQGGPLLDSLVVAGGTVLVSLVIALPASYALAQLRFRGAQPLIFALLIVQMIPGIVMANSLYAVFSDLGLIDDYLGLILADSTATIPFAILVLRAFMLAIPRELTEAARVDGASYWRTFRSIIVPVSRNAMVTAGLFSFLFAWADFLFAVTLTTGRSIEPITVGIYRFIGNQSADWNAVLATAVLASVPAAILLVIAQRYVVAGVTGGAVKE
ncbi:carbohydrate ABC transporter membrane protein 2 (CUT1 family) [Prauserella shujinwangii]|uniref:Carbohydrate ABC transporter membrane protein 2 (CUT1 family) n=1 Tax=Prauserella shujinwangii TaxID=1453103 RepID=A0A2T0LKL7_9PSEU|nr:carbohydrate ABC transporter permease [Prauserella shujinwangii]PRX43452.1 carbohydrate ABC transporter membrane protein 2 (CUT1 family) [Prauserella shujinwangii]